MTLKTTFWNYDRTLPLIDGRVKVDGYELVIESHRPEIMFGKAASEGVFDVSELSFSNTITALSKYEDFAYALIPIFLSRAFRHSSIFIRTDRGISRPADLQHKTIGLQEYDMTAAVVVRGVLRDMYGIDPATIRWKVGELHRTKALDFPLGRPPSGIEIEILPPDKSLEERLLLGELDAIISLHRPVAYAQGDPRIAPLFKNAVETEKEWFSKCGIFPIMHVVGVRKELLKADSGLARRLFEAFSMAKDIAIKELEITQAPKVTLPWPHQALAEARALMGSDHWPYGLVANRIALEAQLRWSALDGLQARPVTVEELFAPDCLDT